MFLLGDYKKSTQLSETFQLRSLDIQKFYCLFDAKRVLEAFETTRSNEQIAWTLLKDRFGNKAIITESH